MRFEVQDRRVPSSGRARSRRARPWSGRSRRSATTTCREVSIAKTIRLVVEAVSEDDARAQVDEMCSRLLANPVIERYTVEIGADTRATTA